MGVLDTLRSDAQEAPVQILASHLAHAREELSVIDPEGAATLTLRDELACTIGRILFEAMTVSMAAADPFAALMGGEGIDPDVFEWLSPGTVERLTRGEGRFAVGYLMADIALEMARPLGELPTID